MKPTEIRDKMMAGEITVQEARDLFIQAREGKPPIKAAPPKTLSFPTAQVVDRQSLAQYRPDLASNLADLDVKHFSQRMFIEETARHAVAIPAYALIGIIDGILDSTGFLVSEVAEDVAFGVTRTIYRFKDGLQRGKM